MYIYVCALMDYFNNPCQFFYNVVFYILNSVAKDNLHMDQLI